MTMPNNVAYDLCCGDGGWADGLLAAGFDVTGFDVEDRPHYPGRFIKDDVRCLDGHNLRGARIIVASPPCEEFSRHSMPWTRAKNPPMPDLSIVEACWRIKEEATPDIFILENVRGAQPFIGPATLHVGPYYLWGDVALLPVGMRSKPKERYSSAQNLARARIPFELAYAIALLAARV